MAGSTVLSSAFRRRADGVDEGAVAAALPPRDDVVHHIAERDSGVGIGKADCPARAEVSEAVGVRPERSVWHGRLEPEAERDVVAQHRAVPRRLRGGGFGEEPGGEEPTGFEPTGP